MDKDFETIIDYVSYPIILSYVVDNEGLLIARFNFHPQMDCDHFIELDKITSTEKEVLLTTEDVRDFANKLIEFANTAEKFIDTYEKRSEKSDKKKFFIK